jgi:hypothetical protein
VGLLGIGASGTSPLELLYRFIGAQPLIKTSNNKQNRIFKPNPLNTNYETAQVSEGVVVDSRRVVLGFCGEVGKRQRAFRKTYYLFR